MAEASSNQTTEQRIDDLQQRLLAAEASARTGPSGPLVGVTPYSGSLAEPFNDFIEDYELATSSEDYTDNRKAKSLYKYLRGPAKTFWQEQPEDIRNDWTEIKNRMKTFFEPPEIQRFFNDLLLARKMLPGEGVPEFASAITRLVKHSFPTFDEEARLLLVRNHFINGLRPDLQFHVSSTKPAATYREAYQMAMNFDTGRRFLRGIKSPEVTGQPQQQVFAGFTLRSGDQSQTYGNPPSRSMPRRTSAPPAYRQQGYQHTYGNPHPQTFRGRDNPSYPSSYSSYGPRRPWNSQGPRPTGYQGYYQTQQRGGGYPFNSGFRGSGQSFSRPQGGYNGSRDFYNDGRPRAEFRGRPFQRGPSGRGSNMGSRPFRGQGSRSRGHNVHMVHAQPYTEPFIDTGYEDNFEDQYDDYSSYSDEYQVNLIRVGPHFGQHDGSGYGPQHFSDALQIGPDLIYPVVDDEEIQGEHFPQYLEDPVEQYGEDEEENAEAAPTTNVPSEETKEYEEPLEVPPHEVLAQMEVQSPPDQETRSDSPETESTQLQSTSLCLQLHPISLGTMFTILALSLSIFTAGVTGNPWTSGTPGKDAYMCPSTMGMTHWQIPDSVTCGAFQDGDKIVCLRERKAQLWLRPAIYGPVNGTVCSCSKTKVSYLRGLNGPARIAYSEMAQPVSELQCHRMLKWHDSDAGILEWDGTGWSTDNDPLWTPPRPLVGCCRWHERTTLNCHLQYTTVFVKDLLYSIGAVDLDLPLHCQYNQGRCATKDGHFLMWQPVPNSLGEPWCVSPLNANSILGYEILLQKADGKQHSLWVAQNGRHLAHVQEVSAFLPGRNCSKGNSATISMEVDEISGQLISLDKTKGTCNNDPAILGKALYTTACNALQAYSARVRFGFQTQPMETIRNLMHRRDVVAQSVGPFVGLRRCYSIPPSQYVLLANLSLTPLEKVPIKFVVHNSNYLGFLDVQTGIITPESDTPVFTETQKLATWMNQTVDRMNLHGHIPQSWMPATSGGIPKSLLTGWPRFPGKETIVINTPEQWRIVREFEHQLFPFWDPVPFGIQHVWLFLVGIYITIAALCLHCCPTYSWLILLNPIRCCAHSLRSRFRQQRQRCHTWRRRRELQEMPILSVQVARDSSSPKNNRVPAPRPSVSTQPPAVPQMYIPGAPLMAMVLSEIANHAFPFLPVHQFNGSEDHGTQALTAVFPLKVNGRRRTALLDTGASISLIRSTVAKKLNLHASGPSLANATGITGHTFPLLGTAPCRLQIGRRKLVQQPLHLVDNAPYDLIIGLDVLQQLGSVTLNFHRNQLHLYSRPPRDSSDMVPLGNQEAQWESVPHNPDSFKVCAIEPITLPPRSRIALIGQCSNNAPYRDLVFTPSPRFIKRQQVLPAHSLNRCDEEGRIQVILLNPHEEERFIYPGTTMGHVEPAHPKANINVFSVYMDPKSTKNKTPVDPLAGLDLGKSNLTEPQKTKLQEFLCSYRDIFAGSSSDLGCFPDVEHTIDTGDAAPIRQRPYRIPASQQAEVEKQFAEMAEAGVVEPSSSPWSSPLVIVPKKDSSARLCVDFRRLNAVSRKDVFPLPLIQDVLDRLSGAKLFTSLDMQSGYWQLKVAEKDRPKTAVVLPNSLWQFVRMPFGLCNAPATFQRAMHQVLLGLQPHVALVYLDDIVIYSANFEEHLEHLAQVLDRFRQYNLKLKLKKCNFGQSELDFLGHLVTAEGLKPNPAKVQAVNEMPPPGDVSGVRRFLGMAGYYRRFVYHFAQIAKPLFNILKKEHRFHWNPEAQNAFDTLKAKLTEAPVLQYPDFRREFTIETDASGYGVGAVLAQNNEQNRLQPVAYCSRVMSAAERNYSATEKECLAVIYGLKQYRHYVLGRHCTILTDHQALRWLLRQQSPSGRLARWALSIQEYDVSIEYRPGAVNYTADALSRAPLVAELTTTPATTLPTREDLKNAQDADETLGPIKQYLENQTLLDTLSSSEKKQIQSAAALYELDADQTLVARKPHTRRRDQQPSRVVVPKSLQAVVIEAYHDGQFSTHPGARNTLDRIQIRYFWNGMGKDIESYVLSCPKCQRRKPTTRNMEPPLHPITARFPFDLIGMDIQELTLSYCGMRYILVIMDHFSKWPEAYALGDQTAQTIATKFMTEFVCRHGVPQRVMTDRGNNFLSAGLQQIYKLCNIQKLETTPYTPSTNGLTERMNRTIQDHLAMLVDPTQRDWPAQLPFALFAIRTTRQVSIGETPYFCLYGQDPLLPLDSAFQFQRSPYLMVDEYAYPEQLQLRLSAAWDRAQDSLQKAQEAQKTQHDQRGTITATVGRGDQVLVRKTPPGGRAMKLGPRWSEPFTVTKVLGPTLLIVPVTDPEAVPIRVHIRRVKVYHAR
ncbi:MAG: DDE-type integrase/transposase/recombinase [Gammaproteobacteria bacterium]|nr:DDE-type integrase/transposase/recombinase [Gammaproteobacteria bacterium]